MPVNQIILRWADTAPLSSEAITALDGLLSADEKAQAFSHKADRVHYAAAHAIKRVFLSRYGGGDPLSWRFRKGPFGKPEPIHEPQKTPVFFNLSHTKDCAAVALGPGPEIGVDVEWCGRKLFPGFAERYFAPEEIAALRVTPKDRQDQIFLTFWTLKEAYIKAIGKGLNLSLRGFAFQLDPLRLLYEEDSAPGWRWHFHLCHTPSDHIIALAVRLPVGVQPDILEGPIDLQGLPSDIAKAVPEKIVK